MQTTSPWLFNTEKMLMATNRSIIFETDCDCFHYEIVDLKDTCWIVIYWPKGGKIAFRLAYAPGDQLIIKMRKQDNGLHLQMQCLIGVYEVDLQWQPVLRFTTKLTPVSAIIFPFWPRDIAPLGPGEIYVRQTGTRSGQLYFSRTGQGSVFYLQNLTALADYNEQTQTSAGDTVGGEWPEIGFALPPSKNPKPLEPGKSYVLSDAFIVLSEETPENEAEIVQQFLDLLAAVYLQLPKPETHYQHWPDITDKGLKDLTESPGCWSQVDSHHYFNAYVSDYATPPEIMVQLAVLLPLMDYIEWNGKPLEIMEKIKAGLPAFYDEKLKTVLRWHPKVADTMEGEEEQKEPLVMDSWYLHHPLLNLSRLALKGDGKAKQLFLDSLPFAIKVAHHFNYDWPVFYRIDTLEVVKAETSPGNGGEKDVPGLYAHILLQAWELTNERHYLAEAEKAAHKLQGLGFNLFYQANNTAFSAGALLRLHKITKKDIYLELSYLCLANIFKNVRLWDCNYGYGKHFPSFFAMFPLSDAPYTAVYEEQEIFCALHDYFYHAKGMDILPSARLLMAEYIRYLIDRAVYYYPPMLPAEMLQEKPKTGEVDKTLWIALEDLHDGWETSGQVGQEVYGAGNAFGILPRHYMQVPGGHFMVYADYPVEGFQPKMTRPLKCKLAGDGRLQSRVMIVKTGRERLPDIRVLADGMDVQGKKVKDGYQEYIVPGNAVLKIEW